MHYRNSVVWRSDRIEEPFTIDRSVLILGVRVGRVSRAVVSAACGQAKGLEVRGRSEGRGGGARHVIVEVPGASRAVHQAHRVARLLVN